MIEVNNEENYILTVDCRYVVRLAANAGQSSRHGIKGRCGYYGKHQPERSKHGFYRIADLDIFEKGKSYHAIVEKRFLVESGIR